MSELHFVDDTQLSQPPRFDIVGLYRDHEPTAVSDLDYLRWHKTVDSFPQELPFPDGRKEQLRSVTRALGCFLADLGVQITPEKVPPPQRFHFFADKQTMNEAMKPQEDAERYAQANGICDSSNIFVVEADNALSHASHEAIHFMSYESWRLTPIQKRIFLRKRTLHIPQQVRSGYQLQPIRDTPIRFDFINELLTEMTNIYVQQKYWQKDKSLPVEATFTPGYIVSLVIGEEMIKQAAAKQGVTPKDIFLPLAKGLFTGDMKALRAVHQAIGKTGFKVAADAHSRDSGFETGFGLAARIGVPQVRERFDEAEQSNILPAFEWM